MSIPNIDERIRTVERLISEHVTICIEKEKQRTMLSVELKEDIHELKVFMNRRFDWMLGALLIMLLSSVVGAEAAGKLVTRIFGL
jgi:hypothetical protein